MCLGCEGPSIAEPYSVRYPIYYHYYYYYYYYYYQA